MLAASLVVALASSEPSPAEPKPSLPIAVTLRAAPGRNRLLVYARLKNLSVDHIGSATLAAIVAKPMSRKQASGESKEYWAPAGFSGMPYHHTETPYLSLEPGGEIEIAIDLGKLKWAKRISSVWPSGTLADVVPVDEYEVSYTISSVSSGQRDISSGGVTLRLP